LLIWMKRRGAETVAQIKAQGGEAIFVRTDISQERDAERVCAEQ